MAEMPLAEPSANVVEQTQHKGFVRVQPARGGDLFRTVGGGAAVVAPRAGVVRFGFGQKGKGFFASRNQTGPLLYGSSASMDA